MAAKSLPKLRVLLLDDEPDARLALKERLRETPGWELQILEAGSAQEAFAALREHLVDLAFLDYRLPDSDGIKVLEQIRQLHPKVAVVVVSAAGTEKIAVEAMKRGAMDYLPKRELMSLDMAHLLRRAAEMRLLQSENAELRQVNRMKDEFISSVSHELRTPLAVILGYAKTMEDGELGPLAPPQKMALKAIRNRGERLLQMVNELLSFKEAKVGTQQVLLRPVDLRHFLIEHLDARWSKLRDGLELSRDIPQEPIWVLADPEHFNEVLDGLLSNAVKFSPQGGRITVRLEHRPNGEAWLSVRDTGRGIPPESLPHLFEGFFHTDNELTREVPGLGLGLALARQIVELHGGRIWIESDGPGKGSAANVALPMTEPASPTVIVEQPKRVDKRRVLLVEDNADIIEVLRLFLAGFSENLMLTTSRDGLEALELMTQSHYDLLVLDILLPGLSGLEVLDRIKRLPKNRRIPILVLTGHKEAARQAMLKGANDYLLKPFDKKTFLGKVLALLGLERRTAPR